ncbi:hypothetical protein J2I47_00430 [Fibrella sp. HMF5335]|uniref:Outer membrane protein beta-barrel domain-containing protein n=1 Tax=Fibrella rubiginis TaxID=2817060 RepID=A0A939G9Z2_9BACT|nr:hypothetical protein [Fibrella rubiginis]MBO0934999.1 hypothetical protein [Fibrella rubiginis]
MKTLYRSVALLGLASLSNFPAFAQAPVQPIASIQLPDSTNGRPLLRIGLNLGLTQLYGDLSTPNFGFGAGLNASYPISSVVAVTLLGDVGSLGAQQSDYYNSKASASYIQGAVGGTFNLTRLIAGKPRQITTSPTNGQLSPDNFDTNRDHRNTKSNIDFYIGVGLIAFDATASSLTTGKLQRYTNGSGSHKTQSDNVTARGDAGTTATREFVVPLGLRYNRMLSTALSIYADLRYNFVASDKLDATRENDNSTIDMPLGGAIYGKTVLSTNRDKWASLSVGIMYQIRRKSGHNRIRITDF